jgi:hypothetical protein
MSVLGLAKLQPLLLRFARLQVCLARQPATDPPLDALLQPFQLPVPPSAATNAGKEGKEGSGPREDQSRDANAPQSAEEKAGQEPKWAFSLGNGNSGVRKYKCVLT